MTPVCPTCDFDRTPLPAGARFCPRCGGVLPEDPAVLLASQASTAKTPVFPASNDPGSLNPDVPLTQTSVSSSEEPPTSPHPVPEMPMMETRSGILLGFANALYRLGWRYETGIGAWRNESEAFRCYGKSAKLGNVAAAARVRDSEGSPPSQVAQ